uniref:Uncharacterized protein n=1 Tax=Rhizophora mucronata TaxID=61149 RepID=A0A2P2R274_RHIMU
MVKEVGSQ